MTRLLLITPASLGPSSFQTSPSVPQSHILSLSGLGTCASLLCILLSSHHSSCFQGASLLGIETVLSLLTLNLPQVQLTANCEVRWKEKNQELRGKPRGESSSLGRRDVGSSEHLV